MSPSRRARAASSLLEVLIFYALVFAVIWIGQKLPWRPPLLVAGLMLLSVCHLSNHRHHDSREKIGLARRHFRPCARLTVKILGLPLAALALLASAQPPPPLPKLIFGLFGYPLWAFAQQYALQSFIANRLREAFGPRPILVSTAAGVLFALIHLPNPMLMSFSLVGGAVFTWIFLKTPHLVPLALAHAAAGFLLSVLFQAQYAAMMVGPAYLRWKDAAAPLP
jgi:membrane protease YdiL (CAAX protease family)